LERGSEKKEKSLRRRMIGERKMRRRRESLQRYSGAAGAVVFRPRRNRKEPAAQASVRG
jgi:hypothetical protein